MHRVPYKVVVTAVVRVCYLLRCRANNNNRLRLSGGDSQNNHSTTYEAFNHVKSGSDIVGLNYFCSSEARVIVKEYASLEARRPPM